MGALICRIRVALLGFDKGHRWAPVMGGKTKSSATQVCLRCRENGWSIRGSK